MGAGIQAPLRAPSTCVSSSDLQRRTRGTRNALDVARQGLRMRVNPEMGDSYLQGIQRQATSCLTDLYPSLRFAVALQDLLNAFKRLSRLWLWVPHRQRRWLHRERHPQGC